MGTKTTCHCPDSRCQWSEERQQWETQGWLWRLIGQAQGMTPPAPPFCPWCGDELRPGVAVPRPPANTPDGARVLGRYMRALALSCAASADPAGMEADMLSLAALADPPGDAP